MCPVGSTNGTAFPCGTFAPSAPESVYCPALSTTYRNVTAGFYTSDGASAMVRSSQVACPAGSYCTGGIQLPCPAGQYGDATKQTSSTCSGPCTAGYYCPAGSMSATAVACGSSAVYCPQRSSVPANVTAGYFSQGADTLHRVSQQICQPGQYCAAGISVDCPLGRFSNVTGSVGQCDGVCSAGYWCPPGSVTGSARLCDAGAY